MVNYLHGPTEFCRHWTKQRVRKDSSLDRLYYYITLTLPQLWTTERTDSVVQTFSTVINLLRHGPWSMIAVFDRSEAPLRRCRGAAAVRGRSRHYSFRLIINRIIHWLVITRRISCYPNWQNSAVRLFGSAKRLQIGCVAYRQLYGWCSISSHEKNRITGMRAHHWRFQNNLIDV